MVNSDAYVVGFVPGVEITGILLCGQFKSTVLTEGRQN